MLVLPIPMVAALVIGYLLLLTLMRRERSWLFSLLLLACAVQGVVIALAQYYGVTAMLRVQPVTATLVPALAWMTFQATALRPFAPARDLIHLGLPAATALFAVFSPPALDLVVPGAFLAYGTAILLVLGPGADRLTLVRLETGERPRLIWGGIALALIASALTDWAIVAALVLGEGWLRPWIVSLGNVLSLGVVAGLCLSQSLACGEATSGPAAGSNGSKIDPARDPKWDSELMARLEALFGEERLYLDPNLTLSRLARRLGVPAKQLSAAINRATGENVSRYVNGFRIRRACAALKAGESVTVAMLNSGFNTKSNFNREFLRVHGCAPSAWLARQQAGDGMVARPRPGTGNLGVVRHG